MKSGFVSIVGKTNVGKSSIINSLVGEKVAADQANIISRFNLQGYSSLEEIAKKIN